MNWGLRPGEDLMARASLLVEGPCRRSRELHVAEFVLWVTRALWGFVRFSLGRMALLLLECIRGAPVLWAQSIAVFGRWPRRRPRGRRLALSGTRNYGEDREDRLLRAAIGCSIYLKARKR